MSRILKIGGIGCGALLLLGLCAVVFFAMLPSSENRTATISSVTEEVIEAPANTVSETDAPVEPTESEEPTAEPTSTPEPVKPEIAKVGERMESAGIAITVLQVQKVTSAGFATAEDGNILVDIEVVLENTDRDEAPYNPMYFKIKDSNNFEYQISFMGSLEPSLQSGNLKKGEMARGHVAFEAPEDATGLVVSYEPLVLFGGYETLKVDLEQTSDTPITAPEGTISIPDGKVGEKLESAGVAITVLKVERIREIDFATAQAGNIFVDIEVVIQNAEREETTPYNPFYFKLKDGDGYEYSSSAIGLYPSLTSGELETDDMVRGHIAFEVPEQATGLVVNYEPEVLFGGYEPIKIDLESQAEQIAEIPQPLGPPPYSFGNPIESAGISLSIISVDSPSSLSGMSAATGRRYVNIEVEIKNVSRSEPAPYNPLYFKIKDSNGYEYTTSFVSTEPSLQSGELPMGESVRGHVAFEVPADATGLVVSYEPAVLFGGYKIIRIPLNL